MAVECECKQLVGVCVHLTSVISTAAMPKKNAIKMSLMIKCSVKG